MAISVTSPQSTQGFIKNATSADLSGTEEIIAAPGAGVSFYISSLKITSAGAITVTLGEGETGGAVTTALIGPVNFAANQTIEWDFNPPMITTANTSLTADASGAGNVCIFVQGMTK